MYELSLAQYNSVYGKLPIPGTFTAVVPTNVAVSGTVNSGDGVVFGRGACVTTRTTTGDFGDYGYSLVGNCCSQTKTVTGYVSNDYKWFGHSSWEDWDSGNPPYLQFVPTRPFSVTDGFMCTLYIEYEEGVSRTNTSAELMPGTWGLGLGEVAIFADFGGGDIRPLIWSGAYPGNGGTIPAQKYAFYQYDSQSDDLRGAIDYPYSDGWSVPNDGTLALVAHYRDIFTERGWAENWSSIESLRIVFQNAWDDMRIRIKSCTFYEPVTIAPTAILITSNTTDTEVEYSVNVNGITSSAYPTGYTYAGTAYSKTGVIYVEGWYTCPGGPFVANGASDYQSYVPNVSHIDTIEFLELDSAERGENILLWDGYGNQCKLSGSWGINTNITYTANSSEGWLVINEESATATVGITLSEGTVASGQSPLKLRWFGIWQSTDTSTTSDALIGNDTLVYVANYTDNMPSLPLSITVSLPFDSTTGGAFRMRGVGERWYSDSSNLNTTDGSTTSDPYYFEFDEFIVKDGGPPVVRALDAKGLGDSIQLTAWVYDGGGLASVSFWEKLSDDSYIPLATYPLTSPYPKTYKQSVVISSSIGVERVFIVTATDTEGNSTDFSYSITAKSDIESTASTYNLTDNSYTIPVFEGFVLDDSSVLLRWTSWDDYISPNTVFVHKVDHFVLYRKLTSAEEFTCVEESISGTALRYHDASVTVPGTYEYRLVGVNVLGGEAAVSCIANIGSGPTLSYIPFSEGNLNSLPKWMAAHPRNYTLDALLGDS